MDDLTLVLFETLRDSDNLRDWLEARCATTAGDLGMHGYDEVRCQSVMVHDESQVTRYVLQVFVDRALAEQENNPVKFVVEHAVCAKLGKGAVALSFSWRLLETISLKDWIFTTCLSMPNLPRESANWLSEDVLAPGLTITPEYSVGPFETETALRRWAVPALERAVAHWDESMSETRLAMSDLVRKHVGISQLDRLDALAVCEQFQNLLEQPEFQAPLQQALDCLHDRVNKWGFALDKDVEVIPRVSTASNNGDGYFYFSIQAGIYDPHAGEDASQTTRSAMASWSGHWFDATQEVGLTLNLQVEDDKLSRIGPAATIYLMPINLSRANLHDRERILKWVQSIDIKNHHTQRQLENISQELFAEVIP